MEPLPIQKFTGEKTSYTKNTQSAEAEENLSKNSWVGFNFEKQRTVYVQNNKKPEPSATPRNVIV